MDRERLTSLINDPTHVAAGDLADLKDLTARYPWFSGAHFLHAAGEHAGGGVLSGETLQTAAAHLPQRAALYDVVYPVVTTSPLPPTVVAIAEPLAAVPPPPPAPALTEVPAAPPEVPVAPVATLAPPPVAHIEEPPAPVIPGEVVPAKVEEDPLPVTEAPPPVDELDTMVRNAAMAQGYEFLLEHTPPLLVAPTASHSTVDELVPPPAPPVAPTPAKSRMRFTDWLDDSAAPAISVPTTPKSPLPTPGSPPPAKPAIKPTPADTGSLIDRFIQQSAPPPAPKAGFFKPQVVAKQSLDDTAGLVTETLARIHEKQGNYAKAMETYQRLALKYPGKSAYFAALSKAIEARLNK